jgi:type I restriction enzyme S subunit
VPEHWEVQRIARVTLDKCDGPFGSGLKSEHYVDEGIRVVRLQNIKELRFDDTDAAFISEDYFRAELTGHEVKSGDVLIAGLGDDNNLVGRACVAPFGIEPAMVKADCFRFRLDRQKVQPGFVAAQLSCGARHDAGVLATGSTRSRIPLSVTATRTLAIPPLQEQANIEGFLSTETIKIDALVAEQERLIALLKEKRQAVISHAVTKGLDPNAPMKDSGVEWLGEVPAHWEVVHARRVISAIEQGWSPECESRVAGDGEWGVVKAGCVNLGVFDEEENKALPVNVDPRPELEIRSGNVIMSRANGSPELVGSVGRVVVTRPRLMLSDKIFRIIPASTFAADYFVALFSSIAMRSQIIQAISGADGLANNLPQSKLREFVCPLPPYDEQLMICEHLAATLPALSALMAEAERAIALLQERRYALISAAVTGKIDVRGLVAADAEAA